MSGMVLDPPSAEPRIDARIRARRIEVRRSEGRRRLRRLLVLLGITLAALAVWGLTRSPLLDIDQVAVEGLGRTTEAEVVAASSLVIGEPLLEADLGAAERGITALPWVASAQVDRSWDGTVTITVEERVATAVVRGADGVGWLVDPEGVVLDVADPTGQGLIAIEGLSPVVPGQRLDPVPEGVLELAGAMPAGVRELVDVVVVDAEDEVWMRLRPREGEVGADGSPRVDGGRVRFGDLRAVEEQVLATVTALAQVDLTDMDVLDVRVPSNFVVTRVLPGASEGEE